VSGAVGVGVIGSPDRHRVDLLARLVEHLPVILVLRGSLEGGEALLAANPIYVRHGDDVFGSRVGIAQVG
jgi:hypothetical protein